MNIDSTPIPARSRHLRQAARGMHPMVAQAYRRRASEIELESWLRAVSTPDRSLVA